MSYLADLVEDLKFDSDLWEMFREQKKREDIIEAWFKLQMLAGEDEKIQPKK